MKGSHPPPYIPQTSHLWFHPALESHSPSPPCLGSICSCPTPLPLSPWAPHSAFVMHLPPPTPLPPPIILTCRLPSCDPGHDHSSTFNLGGSLAPPPGPHTSEWWRGFTCSILLIGREVKVAILNLVLFFSPFHFLADGPWQPFCLLLTSVGTKTVSNLKMRLLLPCQWGVNHKQSPWAWAPMTHALIHLWMKYC